MLMGADERSMPEQVGTQHPFAPSHSGADGADFPAPAAARLDRLGLRGVANFLLDVGRPFGWLGAQVVLVAQPTLSLFGAGQAGAKLAAWLEHVDDSEEKSHRP